MTVQRNVEPVLVDYTVARAQFDWADAWNELGGCPDEMRVVARAGRSWSMKDGVPVGSAPRSLRA